MCSRPRRIRAHFELSYAPPVSASGCPHDPPCPHCGDPRPAEVGAPELFAEPLPPQARRLIVRLVIFLGAGLAVLFYEVLVRRHAG